MAFKLLTQPVGPYSMNTYVIINEVAQLSAIVDPGGDPEKIMKMTAGTKVDKILITHGHRDHTMALDDVREASRYNLRQLFGDDAFYDTLEDVVKDYQKQTGTTAS